MTFEPGLEYVPLLRKLRGQAVHMELGDSRRPTQEIVKGILWDVLPDGSLALVIVFQDETVQRAPVKTALPPPGQPLPVAPLVEFDVFREFYFKWVRPMSIIALQTDANVKIDILKRVLRGTKPDPLYRDNEPNWSTLNNALSDRIVAKLNELGVPFDFKGVLRTDANENLPSAPPVDAAVIDVMPVPEMQPVATP